MIPFKTELAPTPESGWQEWTATFNSGPNPASGALRVELLSTNRLGASGTQQAHFDNVRLDETPTLSVPTNVIRDVHVQNHTFERNGNAGSVTSGIVPLGWRSTGTTDGLMGTFDAALTSRPDGSGTHVYSSGDDLYLLTGEVITADTTYTLTVDLGSRTDGIGFPDGVAIRLGAGDAFGADILTADGIFNPTPAVGTWEEWTFTTTVADGDPLIGEFLRVELFNPGGQQPQYDNVRLTAFTEAFIPEPASLTLLALAGLTLLRRQERESR